MNRETTITTPDAAETNSNGNINSACAVDANCNHIDSGDSSTPVGTKYATPASSSSPVSDGKVRQNTSFKRRRTADLHVAVSARNKDRVAEIAALCSSADVQTPFRGMTALSLAVFNADCEIVKVLIDAGHADVNQRSKDRNDRYESPLFSACRLGYGDIAKILIKSGADVNQRDFYDHSPLWVATIERRLDLVKLLVRSGAKVNIARSWNECPVYLAAHYLNYTGRRQILEYLVASGASPDLADELGRNALYWSMKNKDTKAFRFLVENGARLNPDWDWLQPNRLPKTLEARPTRDTTEFLKWLQGECTEPRPLIRQARTAIRRSLLLHGDGKSIAQAAKELPLPESLKRYILMNEKTTLADADLLQVVHDCSDVTGMEYIESSSKLMDRLVLMC